jgi:UDP-glucuronate 4-epimerase
VILHLAARAGVRPSIAAPHSYVDTNITGTLNVLEVAAKAGIPKVIFASSSSVYGGNHSPPFHEALALNAPMSPYAATKLAGEHLCATYAHLHGIRCVCLRFFTVYGPGQRPDLAIHKFTRAILDGQPITLYGDGQSRRDYTHVDDIAQGILLAAKHTAASAFEVFNLAAGKTTILADLVNLLEQAAGKPAIIERRPPQLGDMLHTSGDITKARQVLGYVPGVLLPDGLQTFLADFLSGRGR